jgi:pyruvate dehydrogenase E1 component alpha subunit
VFHESANLAAVLGLPVIFVCENNGYAEFSPQSSQSLIADVADRAASYGMPGEVVDGMDVCAVHAAAQRAIARAREGDGPMLLEAKTYRYYDHQGVKGLRKSYRSEEEVEQWRNRDPISSFEAWLDTEALLDHGEAASVWAEVAEEVQSAASFADAQPEPDAADLMAYVYAGG